MSLVRFTDGPAKGMKLEIPESLKLGDLLHVPNPSSYGMYFVHYIVTGRIESISLAKLANTEQVSGF